MAALWRSRAARTRSAGGQILQPSYVKSSTSAIPPALECPSSSRTSETTSDRHAELARAKKARPPFMRLARAVLRREPRDSIATAVVIEPLLGAAAIRAGAAVLALVRVVLGAIRSAAALTLASV